MSQQNSNKLTKLVNIAYDIALNGKSKSGMTFHHGAILFSQQNKIIEKGFNMYGIKACNTRVPCIHAEVSCIHRRFEKQRYQKPRCAKTSFTIV